MKNTHDYIHHYRGYWSRGGKCRIRIYQEDGRAPVIVRSQLPDNDNISVTNMAEHLAAERIEGHGLPVPVIWGEHYPENRGEGRGIVAGVVLFLASQRGVAGRRKFPFQYYSAP